ncbi:hypothetical protein AgCh_031691 [Apium graveolens]
MREGVAVRVSNGDELEEGEVNGVVRESEGGELDGVSGDLRVFGVEAVEAAADVVKATEVIEVAVDMEEPIVNTVEVDMEVVVKAVAVAVDMEAVVVVMVEEEREVMVVTEADE